MLSWGLGRFAHDLFTVMRHADAIQFARFMACAIPDVLLGDIDSPSRVQCVLSRLSRNSESVSPCQEGDFECQDRFIGHKSA